MRAYAWLMVGATALSPSLAMANTTAPLPADGMLVYLQGTDHDYTLGLWDSRDGSTTTLVELPECPANVAVADHDRTLVLMDAVDIRLLDLEHRRLGPPIPLPSDLPEKGRSYDAWLAGYTPDGVLALGVVLGEPDGARRLYLLKGGAWVLTEQRQCGYYEESCPFKQKFESRPLSGLFGRVPGQIWEDSLLGDPYVVERIPKELAYTSSDEEGGSGGDDEAPNTVAASDPLKNTLVFRVYGRYSKLRFGVQPGEDTDGTYPAGMQLVTPDDKTHDLADGQFDAVIMGHYMMFYGMNDDGDQLYDLGDGKVVLDHIRSAGWVLMSGSPVN